MSALRRLGSQIVAFFRSAPPALRSAPFWKSTGTIVVTLLLGTGAITPEHKGNALAIVQTAALVVAGVVTVGYTIVHHRYKAALVAMKQVTQTVTHHVDGSSTVSTTGPAPLPIETTKPVSALPTMTVAIAAALAAPEPAAPAVPPPPPTA